MIRFSIVEEHEVTRQLAQYEQSNSRCFDLRAALDFQLARDPRTYSTRVPGFRSEVYAAWTNGDFPELPRLLVWYTVDDEKRAVTIHGVQLVLPPEETTS